MTKIEAAKQLRRVLQMFAETIEDEKAVEVFSVFPKYDELIRANATKERGFRFQYGDKLWRVEQASYTFNGLYAPDQPGTESLFSQVVLPNEGTDPDEPIEYNGNMELEQGKYYMQDGVTYLCIRSTGVPVYNPLSALVGIYVEVTE